MIKALYALRIVMDPAFKKLREGHREWLNCGNKGDFLSYIKIVGFKLDPVEPRDPLDRSSLARDHSA